MKRVVRPRHWFAIIIIFFTCLVQTAPAAVEITQAKYMTSSQLLRSLEQVSLTLRGTDGLLSDYLSREMVQDELAKSGITVRANAPVALEVRLMHKASDWKETKTLFVGGIRTDESVELLQVHFVLVSMHFYVRGAVVRNDRFHVLPVDAASGWWFNHVVVRQNEARREQAASNRNAIRGLIARGLAETLERIDSDNSVDNTPWPPATWTERERVLKNADFDRVMRASSPMDQSLISDLDVQPKLNLNPENLDRGCVVGSDWQRVWTAEFQRLKWIKPQQQPVVTVEHRIDCQLEEVGPGGEFFRSVSVVSLQEANVLFELNGELFRKNGVLLFSEGFASFNLKDRDSVKIDISGEVLGRFRNTLARGTRDAPKLPGAELTAIAGSAKTPVGRVILGGDVRLEQGRWRYLNGTEVPDTLLDKATGGPPLRPRSQRVITQPPVSTFVADIKSALAGVKSCQLYTSASKDNLLWSVSSPALELDESGTVVSRYVLSTRPGQGYAQGAAIANLSLVEAQIQDRGCKVVTVPCKTGQCVRFEEKVNPSLTFFVETTEQANRVLNALKALAPFYPSGAGELRSP